MKYQISFSGGLGSAVTALIAYEQGLDFNLIFADTLIEDDDLYRFLREVASAVGKEIVWLQDGRTPWDVYRDKRWIGNTRTAHCSTELKSKPIAEWIEANAAPNDPLVLGMDMGEQDRIDRAASKWAPRPVVSLLNQYRVPKTEYQSMLDRYGIRKPRLYDMGFSHNNCGGFCCKAGQKQFANLYFAMPERYQWHEQQMEKTMAEIGPTAKPFLREVVKGETQYLTLKDWRHRLENDLFAAPEHGEEGCGCFTDD